MCSSDIQKFFSIVFFISEKTAFHNLTEAINMSRMYSFYKSKICYRFSIETVAVLLVDPTENIKDFKFRNKWIAVCPYNIFPKRGQRITSDTDTVDVVK